MFKLGILASGGGTNLQAIINNVESGQVEAKIAIVISDHKNAFALDRADNHGITNLYLNPKDFPSKEDYEKSMINLLEDNGVELVIMAGFMRILSPYFIKHFKRRVINIHPSLLPSFPGLHAQAQALEYGVKLSGCTVHYADEGMDTGPIILQAAVPVKDDDDEDSLAARILEQEHRIFPKAIQLIIEDRLQFEGRKLIIKD